MVALGVKVGFSFRSVLLALLVGLQVQDACGLHYGVMCFALLSHPSPNHKSIGLGMDRMFNNVTSNGIFNTYYWYKWSSYHHYFNNRVGGTAFEFTLYPLQYSNGNHMNGWFRFKLNYIENTAGWEKLKDFRSGRIRSFVLFAQNEWYETIGEWLTDDQFQPIHDARFKNCPKNDATRYMGIHCGGAFPSQPRVSNTIAYVVHNRSGNGIFESLGKTWIGPPVPWGNTTEMNFYFRISSQSCDTITSWDLRDWDPSRVPLPSRPSLETQPQGIKFVIKATVESSGDGVHVHEVVLNLTSPSVILGASDPIDPTQEVDCTSGEIKEGTKRTVHDSKDLPWWAEGFVVDPDMNQFPRGTQRKAVWDNEWENRDKWWIACNPHLFDSKRCWHNLNVPFTYGGIHPAPKDDYKCNPMNFTEYKGPSNSTVMKYTDYLKNTAVNFMHKCPTDEKTCEIKSVEVVEVDAQTDLEDNRNVLKARKRVLSIPVQKRAPKRVDHFDKIRGLHVHHWETPWNVRKGHGISMVIVTMFLIPVSAFFARYFKETFMTRRIFLSRVWYQVHIHMSWGVLVFTTAGAGVAFIARGFLGKSLTSVAMTHRILAYSSFGVLALAFLGGGLRHYDESTRILTICCHWALGTLLYLINVGALLTAIWIPGSPIAIIDRSLSSEYRELFLPNKSEVDYSIILIIIWVVFDLLANCAMTFATCTSDSEMNVIRNRIYCPTPIPVIRENETASASGSGCRKIILAVYISVAFLVTAVLCYIIAFGSDPRGRGYGPMFCTHSDTNGVFEMKLPKMRKGCSFD